jgi:hypothetical protein
MQKKIKKADQVLRERIRTILAKNAASMIRVARIAHRGHEKIAASLHSLRWNFSRDLDPRVRPTPCNNPGFKWARADPQNAETREDYSTDMTSIEVPNVIG